MMVDYSKWDKFAAELDDSDEEGPKLIKLDGDKGGKVTIGPKGYQINSSSGGTKKDVVKECNFDGEEMEEEEEEEINPNAYIPATSVQSNSASTSSTIVTNKQTIDINSGGKGTYRGTEYEWWQDRYEVTLLLYIDWLSSSIKKRDLKLSFTEHTKLLEISLNPSSKVFHTSLQSFEGKLQYAIQLIGEKHNEYDEILDWEFIPSSPCSSSSSSSRPAIKLSLKKLSPIPNATFWWKKVFEGEPEIDVTKISGRQKQQMVQDEFQQAHELFMQKVKQGNKMEVDYDEEET
jgi:hypothetical protein